jgi:hypothetical protein
MLSSDTYVEVTAKPADSRPDERGNQKMIFVLVPDAKIADFRKEKKKQKDINCDAIAREIAETITPQVLTRKIPSGPMVHGAWASLDSLFVMSSARASSRAAGSIIMSTG